MMAEADVPQFWETYYQNNHFPWDLGGPTPVFERLAAEGQFKPGRLIVLGAGRGHERRSRPHANHDV